MPDPPGQGTLTLILKFATPWEEMVIAGGLKKFTAPPPPSKAPCTLGASDTLSVYWKAETTYLQVVTLSWIYPNSSVIVTARQFFGGPIVCDAGSVSRRTYSICSHAACNCTLTASEVLRYSCKNIFCSSRLLFRSFGSTIFFVSHLMYAIAISLFCFLSLSVTLRYFFEQVFFRKYIFALLSKNKLKLFFVTLLCDATNPLCWRLLSVFHSFLFFYVSFF